MKNAEAFISFLYFLIAERYGQTLPELEIEVANLENKVKSHLERMDLYGKLGISINWRIT